MSVRRGAPKAIMALAHQLLLIVFNVLSRNEDYVELGADFYDRKNRPKVTARLVARLERLGYQVDLRSTEPEVVDQRNSDGEPVESLEQSIQSLDSEVQPVAPPLAAVLKRKRGRPCKCAERGIICKHGGATVPISLIQQSSSPPKFS